MTSAPSMDADLEVRGMGATRTWNGANESGRFVLLRFLQQVFDVLSVFFRLVRNEKNFRSTTKSQAFDELVADETGSRSKPIDRVLAFFRFAGDLDVHAHVFQIRGDAHFGDIDGIREARVFQFAREHERDFMPNLFRDAFVTMSRNRHG